MIKYNVTNMTPKLSDVTLCVTDIYIMLNYYFIMILLTIERFLVFYSNMKYHFFLSSHKEDNQIDNCCFNGIIWMHHHCYNIDCAK